MKTEVYSWRVSTELKIGLEREARRRQTSLSKILDLAAQEWLMKSGSGIEAAEEQARLQQAASECLGAFEGRDSRRSEKVRETARQRLRRQHDR